MNVITATYNSNDICDLSGNLMCVLNVESYLNNLTTNIETPKKQNVRNELLNELYQLYLAQCNKHYYVQNKKRYFSYIKSTHPGALANAQTYKSFKENFKRAKLPDHQKYLKPYKESDYMWYKRFNKTTKDDLREMISTAKDKIHRKENVIAYILGATKDNEV